MREKLTTEKFIQRARDQHGGKYNYEFVFYVDSKTKVQIGCPEHEIFKQLPYNHLSGQGCPKCARILKASRKGIEVTLNGKVYDSISEAVKSFSKEKGIKPPNLLMVHSRLRYGFSLEDAILTTKQKRGNIKEKTEVFIKKAEIKHGNKYNYDSVIYKKSDEKIKILCPEHGIFEQLPSSHLSGCGCPECFRVSLSKPVILNGKEYRSLAECILMLANENNIINPPSVSIVRERIKSGMSLVDAIITSEIRKTLTKNEKDQIDKLSNLGKTPTEISKILERNRSTINNYLRSKIKKTLINFGMLG